MHDNRLVGQLLVPSSLGTRRRAVPSYLRPNRSVTRSATVLRSARRKNCWESSTSFRTGDLARSTWPRYRQSGVRRRMLCIGMADTATRNRRVLEYNRVIRSAILAERGVLPGPDLFSCFLAPGLNRFSLFEDQRRMCSSTFPRELANGIRVLQANSDRDNADDVFLEFDAGESPVSVYIAYDPAGPGAQQACVVIVTP